MHPLQRAAALISLNCHALIELATTVVTLKFGADWGYVQRLFVAEKRTLNMTHRMEHQLARIQQSTSVPHGISCQ